MLSSVREDYKIEERLKDSGLHIRREGYISCVQDIYTVHAGYIYRTRRTYISYMQDIYIVHAGYIYLSLIHISEPTRP